MGLPAVVDAGPVLVTATSAEAVTVVLADAELLAAFGSDSLPVTVAVLVTVPAAAGAVALIVKVALAPDASEPATLQVTVPGLLVQPALADTKVTPVGRVSLTVTPVAGSGPLLLAVTV